MSENTKKSAPSPVREPIAVVGVSCLMPGSIDATGFWRNILEGNDLISDVPPTHWLTEDYYDANPKARDKTYANRGAFLPEVDFDPLAWGVPPSIVPATDTCQLLALIVAQRVLDDATRGQFKDLDRERVSVMLGVTSAQELLGSMVSRLQKPIWQKSLRDMGLPESQVQDACDRIASHYVEWQESTFPGVLGNVVAGRIANRLDLHGTNCVTDAACASTFSALSMGVNELRLNEADMVVIGGADTMNDIFMYMCFSKTPALSPSGDCRPFSDQADGTMLGEGIGMVALKRLSDAEANGDKVYAVLRGVGTSSDGRAKSVYAPLPEGQARAVKRCYQQAGFGPESVELLEAHGTGTKAGDAAEFDGLRLVFETPENDDAQWCALGSVKSQIGHTKAAAGAAGLVKAVLALHHRTLPPSIKIDNPNPLMDMDSSPFYLATEARPWVRGDDHLRRAGVSSFGFGGSNFHLALEEAPSRSVGRHRTAPTELVIVSADDAASLASACRKLSDEVGNEAGTLTFLARSTQSAYDPKKNARAAVIVKDEAELIEKLRKAADLAEAGKSKSAPMVHVGFGAPEGDVAFMFPGQGSQYTFMGADLAMAHDAALAVWDRHAKAKLHDIVFPKPAFGDEAKKAREERLTETQNAQPSIGLTSASMLALLKGVNLEFSMSAGHSYGEISALHAAGAMDEATFLAASQARGASMAEAAEQSGGGTMLAVSATREEVAEIVKGIDVVAANHNHPTQVVLSGSVEAIQEAEAKLKAAKKRATLLPVATAFHSPIVAGAVEPFAKRLETLAIQTPNKPVYCNATTAAYEGDPKARIAGAIASPVRFVEEVRAMAEAGARTFVEVGPGSVLTGLIGRILKGESHRALSMDRKGRHGLTSMQDALGQLVADGRAMKLSALWEEYALTEDPRAATKPKLTLKLNGSNYDKPYPPKNGAAGLPKPNPERAPETVEKVVEVDRIVEKVVEKIVEVPVERIVEKVVEKIVEVPVHVPAAAHAAPQQAGQSEWLTSFAQAQQQTVDAHRAFQEMMAQSHQSFLQASQTSVFGMSMHAPSGYAQSSDYAPSAPSLPANNPMPQTLVSYPAPEADDAPTRAHVRASAAAPVAAPAPVAAAPAPVAAPAPRPAAAPAPRPAAAPVAAPVAPAPAKPAAPTPAPTTGGIDTAMLQTVLLQVVSEKTGYPGEMLDLHMDMEADLGIDSIKRVEILSGIKEQVDGLPEVDAAELSKTRTLAEIVGIYEPLLASAGNASAPAAAPAAATPATQASAPAAASAGPNIDSLRTVLLSVVSEKTGYPPEMLDLNMDMEADLGIDSIKRVEILSGMKEQVEGLPEVDAAELSKTRTLAEIVGIYEPLLGAATAAPATPTPVAAAAPSASIDQLQGVLLNVVAEKTGYPPEMLDLNMDMEADLGIDSIKRVEILSGMKEKIEGLPEVDAAELSKTRTLAEIVGIYEPLLGGVPSAPAPAAAAPNAPASSGGANIDQLQGVLLNVVAEKTGYPPEMLDMGMDMEADLGIDSIKRVEILSGMKEKIEGLPEVDAAELSKTRTLAEIVGIYEPLLSGSNGGSAPSGFSEAASAAAPSEDEFSEDEVGRYVTYLAEAPKAGFALQGLAEAKSLLIVSDSRVSSGGRVAVALKERLQSAERTVRIGGELDASTDGVIFLGGLRSIPDVATAREIQREVFRLARDFAKQSAPKFFVSVQDTGGAFGLEDAERLGARAWVGGIPGLIKTAALEWPNVGCRAIDIATEGHGAIDEQSAGVLAARIDDELHTGGQEVEIALGPNGRRRMPRVRAERVNPSRRPVAPGAVVVASGGARGVTASSLIAFAAASKCRLVLLGRTPLQAEDPALTAAADDASLKRLLMEQARAAGEKFTPADIGSRARRVLAGREIRSTLASIEAAGGAARYEATDVQDEAKLRATLDQVRREWGPIAGIVHGAGVLADKRIEDKTDADFDRVFDTKVLGLEALLKACAEDPIQLLCSFSSVAGRAGNVGQCDYAMANEVLNKVTSYEGASRSARGVTMVAKSIGWGPWAGGMVTPALKAHFEAQGVPLIPIEGGAKMFAAEMAAPGAVELVAGASPDAWTGATRPEESSYDVIVHKSRESFLSSHRVKGEVVVPVVLVLEWFARAAQLHCPDKRVISCDDVKVFQGLVLPDFDAGKSHHFVVSAKQISNGDGARVALELRDKSGRACYRATAHLAAPGQTPAESPRSALTGLAPLQGKVYGDVLFHGSEFQVIRGVDGVGHGGAAATMLGARSMGWPGAESDWQTDPALMDGGLQLALLWTSARLGGHSLPTGVESLKLHSRGLPHGSSRVELRAREAEGDKGVCDVVFMDSDGETIAELRGVTTHVLPGTR